MRFYSISLQKVPVIVAETAPASCFDVCWANRNKNAEINLQVTQQNALIFITPQLTRDKGVKTLNFSECFKKKNILRTICQRHVTYQTLVTPWVSVFYSRAF